MKGLGCFTLVLLFSFAEAKTNFSGIDSFLLYTTKAQKEYKSSEKKLLKIGDSYLKQHAAFAEKLSLAEMLPTKSSDLTIFCKTFKNKVSDYYNLGDLKLIKTIKSPIYNEFSGLVSRVCKNN